MAQKMVIEWNHAGFEALLCDEGTMALVQQQTDRICENANANNSRGGNGFESGTRLGKAYGSQRALGFVYSTDNKSALAESEDKALSRAVSG